MGLWQWNGMLWPATAEIFERGWLDELWLIRVLV